MEWTINSLVLKCKCLIVTGIKTELLKFFEWGTEGLIWGKKGILDSPNSTKKELPAGRPLRTPLCAARVWARRSSFPQEHGVTSTNIWTCPITHLLGIITWLGSPEAVVLTESPCPDVDSELLARTLKKQWEHLLFDAFVSRIFFWILFSDGSIQVF